MTGEADQPQPGLFGDADLPKVETVQVVQSIYVHFERPEDIVAFSALVGFPVTQKTRALRYPFDDMFPDLAPSALAAMKPEEPREGEEEIEP